jgi:hypothetical protein
MSKELGAIYTPEGHARILISWAIQSSTDVVLDMGIGPGVFIYHAYKRLMNLGASKSKAVNQIYGSEIDKEVFERFTQDAARQGLVFKNLQNINFFDSSFPVLDAVVGNPPYVRRRGMNQENLSSIRDRTLLNNPNITSGELSNLSDLYVYFLLSVLPQLKPGGRLATILADTWLNTRYGTVLKSYLLKEFDLHQLVSLDRSIFENADVKAVLLLATKKSETSKQQNSIRFARVRNGLSIKKLSLFVNKKRAVSDEDIIVKEIKGDLLDAEAPWGAIFKSTALFDEINSKNIIKPMREIADIRIGIESLARDFFVFSIHDKEAGIVEDQYLAPFIYSVHDFDRPVIENNQKPFYYLFCCDFSKESLQNTKALEYITRGESIKVNVRGTSKSVIGYHNKERMIKANRPHWYNLKAECDRKPIAEILLPRFIYKDYIVLWNIARYIPGGTIVQFFPRLSLFSYNIDTKVYLAILTSAFTEIALRINAQVYGGGTSNLNITSVKDSPTIDVTQLTSEQKQSLMDAYDTFLHTKDKAQINLIVYEILGLTKEQSDEMNQLLIELRQIAESAKKAAHPVEKSL